MKRKLNPSDIAHAQIFYVNRIEETGEYHVISPNEKYSDYDTIVKDKTRLIRLIDGITCYMNSFQKIALFQFGVE